MLKNVAFILLLVHGIGHFQGVLTGLGVKVMNSHGHISWLLNAFLNDHSQRIICLGIYLIAGLLGIITALSFMEIIISREYWQVLAIITAFTSLLALILYPNALAMFFNKIGALAVNLIIIYSIVFSQYWPNEIFNN